MKTLAKVSFAFSLILACVAGLAPATAQAQSFADTILPLTAAMCPGSVTTGTAVAATGAPAVGTGLMVLTTPFAPVYQTSATGAGTSTHSYTCEIPCFPGRTTFGKGCSSVVGLAFHYGVQTTALTSENAPVAGTVAFPVPAAGETPSTVAFVAVPVTALPVVGSANLGTTTVGAFFTQYVSITTPPSLPSAAGVVYQKMFVTTSWVQSAAAAQIVNTPGGLVFTTWTLSWMRKHGHDKSVDAMLHYGINRSTAELIFAHYVPTVKVCPDKGKCLEMQISYPKS